MKARMEQNSGGGRQRENMEEGFRTLSYSVVLFTCIHSGLFFHFSHCCVSYSKEPKVDNA